MRGDAIAVANAVAHEFGGRVDIHTHFGTATWQPPAETKLADIDFVTARRETYAFAGALPTVYPSTIEDDSRRRDFTINTLSIKINGPQAGEIYDVLDGQSDMAARSIRVLHDQSFVDDPTRIFRAVRYAQRLGYEIEPQTQSQLHAAISHIDVLSSARIWHELAHMLSEVNWAAMLASLQMHGVLAQISPNFKWLEDWESPVANGLSVAQSTLWPDTERLAVAMLLWLANHAAADQPAICERLGVTANFVKELAALNSLVAQLSAINGAVASPSEYDAVIHPHGNRPNALLAAFVLTDSAEIAQYRSEWQQLQPLLTGNDLRAAGLTPGPHFKTALADLRAKQIDGDVNSPEDAQRWLASLL